MQLRLGAFWFLFMGGLGAVFPFFSLYFRENAGLSGVQLGVVLGILPLVGLVAQPLWGQLADRTGSRSRILALVCLGGGLSYLLVPMARGFGPILLVMAVVASFSTAAIPLATSVTLAILGADGSRRFGSLRVWGTVGFLALVVCFPLLLDAIERLWNFSSAADGAREPALASMFVITGTLWLAASVLALRLPQTGQLGLRATRGEWRQLLRHGPYRRIVLFAFGAYLCFQGPMVLFPVYVRSLGGDLETVSRLWIPMLALEIPLVALSGASIARVGARGLVTIGILAGALRWSLCAATANPLILYPAQLLHGVIVAGVIIGAPLYVEESVPEQLRSTGQTLLAMVGFGVGGVLSNVMGGWLLDAFGAAAPALVGGIGGFVLAALLPLLLPPPQRPA